MKIYMEGFDVSNTTTSSITTQQKSSENLFFIANRARNGNGHITPEGLKTKLLEYKHQLDFVKSLYSNGRVDGDKSEQHGAEDSLENDENETFEVKTDLTDETDHYPSVEPLYDNNEEKGNKKLQLMNSPSEVSSSSTPKFGYQDDNKAESAIKKPKVTKTSDGIVRKLANGNSARSKLRIPTASFRKCDSISITNGNRSIETDTSDVEITGSRNASIRKKSSNVLNKTSPLNPTKRTNNIEPKARGKLPDNTTTRKPIKSNLSKTLKYNCAVKSATSSFNKEQDKLRAGNKVASLCSPSAPINIPISLSKTAQKMKYERSDSELSSCSNASSYCTGI